MQCLSSALIWLPVFGVLLGLATPLLERRDHRSLSSPPGNGSAHRRRDEFSPRAEASPVTNCAMSANGGIMVLARITLGELLWNRISRKRIDFVLCDPQIPEPLVAADPGHARERTSRETRIAYADTL